MLPQLVFINRTAPSTEPIRRVVVILLSVYLMFIDAQKHVNNVTTLMRDKKLIMTDNSCFDAQVII